MSKRSRKNPGGTDIRWNDPSLAPGLGPLYDVRKVNQKIFILSLNLSLSDLGFQGVSRVSKTALLLHCPKGKVWSWITKVKTFDSLFVKRTTSQVEENTWH